MNGEHGAKMMIKKTCLTGLIAILFLLLAAGISFAEDANDIVRNYWYLFLSAAIIFVVMTGFIIEILNLNRRMSASRIRLAEEISIRERAEKNLVKAKKAAESSTEAKGAFLANMSHEIRTPMNGIIAATDLALGEDLSPRVKRFLEIIQSSAYSLLELINDILDFSKVEAGRLELKSRPFMLDTALEKTMDMFIKKSSEKNIELVVDMDLEMPRAFTGDTLRLQQIIKNLVDNAIKFTKKGGIILVGAKALEKTSDQATLAFFVKDTGVGIAPEYLCQLFKPFSQADVSFTRKYAGTGLGLSICKKLVEMMDGRIWVESKLGKGSAFHFTATFKRRTKERKRRLIPRPDIQDLKVLVVDDCPDSRTIMHKILESFGFRPESVSSGKEGLSMLRNNLTDKEPFELVIIDWRMPEMDGIEASRIIRHDLKLTIPIILMTAFGREAEKIEAQKAGINIFLTKPIFQSTLFNAIINAFGKESTEVRPGKEITTKAPISKKRLKGVSVQPLVDALELADPEEINIHFKAVKEYLDFSTFQKLENQINNYDYDRALKTLKGIMEEIEGLGN
ncbi:MAG: ATP-binding protein [Thermodesulfobacteriota bacterium]|nr:ATP-binding protein [Thermodesulfobacteriota bacterium]